MDLFNIHRRTGKLGADTESINGGLNFDEVSAGAKSSYYCVVNGQDTTHIGSPFMDYLKPFKVTAKAVDTLLRDWRLILQDKAFYSLFIVLGLLIGGLVATGWILRSRQYHHDLMTALDACDTNEIVIEGHSDSANKPLVFSYRCPK